jgi:hypothetical protein
MYFFGQYIVWLAVPLIMILLMIRDVKKKQKDDE